MKRLAWVAAIALLLIHGAMFLVWAFTAPEKPNPIF
jgi:hypothetical protein